MAMMRAHMSVGRLLEVRALMPVKLEEIPALAQAMKEIFERTPGQVVAILDARDYGVEPPEAAAHFASTLKRDNPRIERSAFLIGADQAVMGLQLERIIREAGNPNRRLFRSLDEAVAFLEPVLMLDERLRLKAFLA
jgi:hypothetical protein